MFRVRRISRLASQQILFRCSQGSDRHLDVYIFRWIWFLLMENDSGLQTEALKVALLPERTGQGQRFGTCAETTPFLALMKYVCYLVIFYLRDC
jgi:hypothetical protein